MHWFWDHHADLAVRTDPKVSPRRASDLSGLPRAPGLLASVDLVTQAAVTKHVGNIFGKLGLEPAEDDHRRVLAVLAYLKGARGRLW